jgi:DNA primase
MELDQFSMLEREQIVALSQASLYENSNDATEARDYLFNARKISEPISKDFCIGYVPVRVNNKKISGRIIFPIWDCHGDMVALSTRDFRSSIKNRGHWHESFNKKHHLYGWKAAEEKIKQSKQAIVVEGQFDVLAMHSHGFANTVGVLGSHLSTFHIMLLIRYADEIVFAFDNDDAGQKAYQESYKIIASNGLLYDKTLSFFKVDLGIHKDPDELLKSSGRDDMEMHIEASRKVKQTNDAAQWSANVSDLSID